MLPLFLITLGFTIVLFIGAALIFNYSKQRSARRDSAASGCGQHGSSGGCACTSALQATIKKI